MMNNLLEPKAEACLKGQAPSAPSEVYDRLVATSQAISLKRIADALELMAAPVITGRPIDLLDPNWRDHLRDMG